MTGAWLPYSPLRDARVPYHEVADIDDVAACLTSIVDDFDDFDAERERAKPARGAVRSVVGRDGVMRRWLEIYADVVTKGTP